MHYIERIEDFKSDDPTAEPLVYLGGALGQQGSPLEDWTSKLREELKDYAGTLFRPSPPKDAAYLNWDNWKDAERCEILSFWLPNVAGEQLIPTIFVLGVVMGSIKTALENKYCSFYSVVTGSEGPSEWKDLIEGKVGEVLGREAPVHITFTEHVEFLKEAINAYCGESLEGQYSQEDSL